MVALNRNSLGFGRAKVNMPKMTGVPFSVTVRAPCSQFQFGDPALLPASRQRPHCVCQYRCV
jgi:hypothetical protein